MKIKFTKIQLLLFLIYAFGSLLLVWFHEPFRDEAQKWLIARDCGFWGIIEMAGYEGHPALWTFLIVPFAKFGFPIFIIQLLNWAIMCMAILIFITKSPFHIAIKFAFCLSYFIMYEYTVIARNYCLVILGLMLFATLFKDRKSKILLFALTLFLLSQAHALMIGVVGGAIVLQMIEYKNYSLKQQLIFFGITFLGLLLLFYQVKRPFDSIFIIDINKFTLENLIIGLDNFAKIMLYLLNPIPVKWFFIFFILLPILYFYQIRLKYLFILFVFLLPLFIVNAFVYSFNAWHSFLPFIFVILFIWIILEDKNIYNKNNFLIANILLFLCLFISAFYNLRFFQNEIMRPFSESKEMAEIIKSKKYDQSHLLVAESDYGTSPILVYLPNLKVFHPSYYEMGTFARWRFNNQSVSSSQILPLETVLQRSNDFLGNDKKKMLIIQKSCVSKNLIFEKNLKITDSSSSTVFGMRDESYYLIEF